MSDLIKDATERKYALGLFVAADNTFIKPIIEAAEEEDSPVIIAGHFDYLKSHVDVKVFARTVKTHAENVDIPVVLHLDHGGNLQQILQCISEGFNSIMFDGSNLPLYRNILLTKKVVEVAKALELPVEGEINKIPLDTDIEKLPIPEELMTEPEEAKRFVEETEIDSLAIAIGQVHRIPKLEGDFHSIRKIGKLNLERIKMIREVTDVALCLHGSTHTPDDQIKKAIKLGVSKINIGTALMTASADSIRRTFEINPDIFEPDQIKEPSQKKIKEIVKEKMRVIGSAKKW